LVTCDHCQLPIASGEQYSLTEHGRLHAACLWAVAPAGRAVLGEGRRGSHLDPVYVWKNREPSLKVV
jgi:hypothetical protein